MPPKRGTKPSTRTSGTATNNLAAQKKDLEKQRKKEAKQRIQEETQREKAKRDLVRSLAKRSDFLDDMKPFQKYNRNGLDLSVSFRNVADIDKTTMEECFKLIRGNMKERYERVWGWKDSAKWQEMTDEDARYLLVRDEAAGGEMVAFVHHRFEIYEEDREETLYVYDIQLKPKFLRKGLGRFLMQILELIARKNGIKKIALTVFKENDAALSLYKNSLGYSLDPSSPTPETVAEGELILYEILSKRCDGK